MSIRPGSIITMTSFSHVQPTMTAGFKAPKGRVAVFLLLGDADRKQPDSFDPEAALRRIGWYPESDFGPVEPSNGSIKDRAAELAASMKVMAALHRGNDDVAAADEFAQGAGLVTTMAGLIELLTADLTEAATTLRRYEALHRAKGTDESIAKAEVNAELAARFEATIAKVSPDPELTEDAQADRDEFNDRYGEGSCSCHNNPPCSSCTHPGNPINQAEDPACWKVQP